MGFFSKVSKIKNNLGIIGEANKYEKVGYNYSERQYDIIKTDTQRYINNIEQLIKLYNERKEVKKDEYGNNVKDGNRLVRPNKATIYILFTKNNILYKKIIKNIGIYLSTYVRNNKLEYKRNILTTLSSKLTIAQDNITYHDKLFGENQTTAKSPIKIKNSFRWKNQRKKSIDAFNNLIEAYKKL